MLAHQRSPPPPRSEAPNSCSNPRRTHARMHLRLLPDPHEPPFEVASPVERLLAAPTAAYDGPAATAGDCPGRSGGTAAIHRTKEAKNKHAPTKKTYRGTYVRRTNQKLVEKKKKKKSHPVRIYLFCDALTAYR